MGENNERGRGEGRGGGGGGGAWTGLGGTKFVFFSLHSALTDGVLSCLKFRVNALEKVRTAVITRQQVGLDVNALTAGVLFCLKFRVSALEKVRTAVITRQQVGLDINASDLCLVVVQF